MKSLYAIVRGVSALALAQNASSPPGRVLLDAGLRSEAQQRPAKARLVLRTLVLTYPQSLSTPTAKRELAALTLFITAQSDIAGGRTKRAELTLQTLLNTYPESPLAPQAESAIQAIR